MQPPSSPNGISKDSTVASDVSHATAHNPGMNPAYQLLQRLHALLLGPDSDDEPERLCLDGTCEAVNGIANAVRDSNTEVTGQQQLLNQLLQVCIPLHQVLSDITLPRPYKHNKRVQPVHAFVCISYQITPAISLCHLPCFFTIS